jgi:arylsulfatase A-like enzyme
MRRIGRTFAVLSVLTTTLVWAAEPATRSSWTTRAAPTASSGCGRGRAARPNIIFILADDLGYGDIGPFGQQRIRTPHLDRLAAEGTCFEQFYAGAAVCAPTRCTLMTGLHTGHGRVRGNHGNAGLSRVPLCPEDLTVAEMLRSAGYATAGIGKWGLGEPDTTGLPNRKGFDFWFGYLNQDLAEDYFPARIWRNEHEILLPGNAGGRKGQYSNDLMTDEAVAFIEANRSRSFFLYLAYTIPHAMWEVPGDSLAEYTGRFDEPLPDEMGGKVQTIAPRATYAAMVTRLDRYVGRLLEKIRGLKLDDETIVFFASDNGAPRRAGVSQFFGSNGPFRGNKGSLYEGGIHTPMIVRGPGRIPAGRRSTFAWAGWDFLPTVAALAGIRPPENIDGISVVPSLLGRPQSRNGYLYWETIARGRLSQAVRIGDRKAVRNDQAGPIEVYDLAQDRGETKDIAAGEFRFVAQVEQILGTARTESEHWPVEAPAGKPAER